MYYNNFIVDTYIVGKYIGSNALAAVDRYTLMTFLTFIIIGLCMGSGILFSMYFGAKNMKR
ncbi:MAG: MATE family efflux transporter [Faecalibacillus faecis]